MGLTTLTRFSDLSGSTVVLKTRYSYDSADRLTTLSHQKSGGTVRVEYGYTLDDANRLTGESRTWANGASCRPRPWSISCKARPPGRRSALASYFGSVRTAEGMMLLWLSNRASELNPTDTLWGQGKEVVSANKQYDTIKEHVEHFLEFVEGLSGREVLHTSGVLADNFWLKATLSKKALPTC